MQLLIFFQIDLITLFLLKIISMYQKSQHAIRNQKINSCTASYEWLITLLLDLNLSVLWWIDYWNICKCRVFSTENIRDFFLLYKWTNMYSLKTHHKEKCGAHGSVVTCVKPVTKRSLVQTPLWELIWNGLVFIQGESINDSYDHLLN